MRFALIWITARQDRIRSRFLAGRPLWWGFGGLRLVQAF